MRVAISIEPFVAAVLDPFVLTLPPEHQNQHRNHRNACFLNPHEIYEGITTSTVTHARLTFALGYTTITNTFRQV